MVEQHTVTVGMTVPDFEMEICDPAAHEFGKVSLAQQRQQDKWTILAFDPADLLVSSEVHFYSVGRNAEELLRKMEANVHPVAHPDEAGPAKWHKGAKTLRPGRDLVGKVYEALKA